MEFLRIHINNTCNVLTDEDCKGYHRPPKRPVEITIPQFRANLRIPEAEQMAIDILEAVNRAKEDAEKPI